MFGPMGIVFFRGCLRGVHQITHHHATTSYDQVYLSKQLSPMTVSSNTSQAIHWGMTSYALSGKLRPCTGWYHGPLLVIGIMVLNSLHHLLSPLSLRKRKSSASKWTTLWLSRTSSTGTFIWEFLKAMRQMLWTLIYTGRWVFYWLIMLYIAASILSNQHQFPYLCLTALDIPPAQALSVSSEQEFLLTKEICTLHWNKIAPVFLEVPQIHILSRMAWFLITFGQCNQGRAVMDTEWWC